MGKKSRKGQQHHASHQHHKAGEGTNGHHQLHSVAWYKSHHHPQQPNAHNNRVFGSDRICGSDDTGSSMTSNSNPTEPMAEMDTSFDHRRLLLSSDVELSTLHKDEQENALQQILDNLGNLLDSADAELERFEEQDDGLLKSAIVRSCGDLAWIVGGLAEQLESQTEEERQTLAQAFLADAPPPSSLESQDTPMNELASMKESDFMDALQAAAGFLRDVEASLRSIDEDTAEELADAGLTVARLFIVSLQSIHSTITPEDILEQTKPRNTGPQMEIEFLDEEDRNQQTTQSTNQPAQKDERQQRKDKSRRRKRSDRLKVLWPPLGPQVRNCLEWLKVEAAKRPVLSVALGCVLWPTAVVTAFVGVPVVIADGFLQDFYKNFQDTPPIVGLERGAAHLYHTARLAILSGKLVGRQSLFVAKRQIERHGGMEKIAQNILGAAVDRIIHPVESFHMVCDGIGWTVDQVRRTLEDLHDEERSERVQELQVSNKPQRVNPEGSRGSGSAKFPLLFLICCLCIQHARCDWVDPDTPEEVLTTAAFVNGDDREFQLVGSYNPVVDNLP